VCSLTWSSIIVLLLVLSGCLSHLVGNEIHNVCRINAYELNDIF
jgi:hypothetical protein